MLVAFGEDADLLMGGDVATIAIKQITGATRCAPPANPRPTILIRFLLGLIGGISRPDERENEDLASVGR
ncbi:MAG: hypothetical protein ACRDSL_02415 [Pseudonocardiaceae bacterium]